MIVQQFIDNIYKTYIGNYIRYLKYGGKNIIIFKVKSLADAALYEVEYYKRKGANITKVPPRRLSKLFDKFR